MLRLLALITFSLLAMNCSPEHRAGDLLGGSDIDQGKGDSNFSAGMPFSEITEKVFKPAGCFDCHSKYKNYATMAKIVIPGSPETSRLYLRAAKDMPPTLEGYAPLNDDQLDLIRAWIAQGAQE